ncbi:MAG: hypothetical protein A2136_08185 [Chloroflexi bacterium RBG_16_54_11]|nr:MAG: hypothetical protein A2136_08185 [Chloroflexi bacterium RBG_16_54_11]
MKKVVSALLVTVFIISGLFFSAQLSPAVANEPKILEFDTMVGVPQAFTGAQNPIRGINGGGLPWTLTSAKGELFGSGKLEITVEGLVLAAGANAGRNPSANFRATVSCLRSDASIENVTSELFPATLGAAVDGGGNSMIETTLSLPQPCIAPIIFVTSAGGSWFAATGK